MRWSGKVIGGALGLALGPVGAAIGVLLGHQYDLAAERAQAGAGAQPFGPLFFVRTFEVMGHLAKADGRVSEREIEAARGVMAELRLDEANVRTAIGCFHRGKAPGYDLEAAVRALRLACGNRPDLLRVFFEIQMRAALAGSDLAPPTRVHVQRLAKLLGIGAYEFAYIESALRTGRAGGPGARAQPTRPRLDEAYAVLQVEAAATDSEIVKAYRRQISRHHPDKLQARGLPESMLEHAKQRTQQIIEAYELIRAQRGMS